MRDNIEELLREGQFKTLGRKFQYSYKVFVWKREVLGLKTLEGATGIEGEKKNTFIMVDYDFNMD